MTKDASQEKLKHWNTPQEKLKRMSWYFNEVGIYTKANYCLEIAEHIDELEKKNEQQLD
jgi:hypothetical protein